MTSVPAGAGRRSVIAPGFRDVAVSDRVRVVVADGAGLKSR